MPEPQAAKQQARRKRRPRKSPDPDEKDRRAAERAVDDVLEDSFPASDPPPWTLGRKDRGDAPDEAGE